MIIETTYTNATEGHMIGEERIPVEDTIFGEDATPGDIFRWSRDEYGRCISKVYVDSPDGPRHVGWVFQKREKYQDSPETYLAETWVTLLARYEHRTVREHVTLGVGL